MTRQITRRGLFRGLISGQDEARLNNPNIKNITINSNICIEFKGISCRRCGEVCDQSAIAFKLAGRGLYKPVIDINQCTLCGECLKICPVNAMTLVGLDSRDQNQERAGTDGKYQT